MTARQSAPMRFRHAGIALATLAALFLALSPGAPSFSQASSKVIGIAAALVRDVRIKPAALNSFAAARLRQRIALGDQLRTGADSRLQIALLDKTRISLGANTQMTIDKFVFDANGGSVSVNAAKGALRFMSGSTGSTRTVRTPSATIGIRGTLFDTAVGELAVEIARRERAIPPGTSHDPLTATLAVLRGPGPNRQGRVAPGAIDVTAAGQTVALEQPLLAAYVPHAGAPPIGPFAISLPGLALLNQSILPPPPERQFEQASQGQPVPNRDRSEPPPWFTGGAFPPDGGPDPGFGAPGGPGAGFPALPNPGGFPQRPAGPVNNPPAARPTANAAPTPPPAATQAPPPATTQTPPPTTRTQAAPTAAQPADTKPPDSLNNQIR